MTTESRIDRARRLRPLVSERVQQYESERKAAEEIGVSHTALNKFLKGETPYQPTLAKYEAWLASGDAAVAQALGANRYSPADQIVDDVCRLAGMEPDEYVLEAYRRALRRRLPRRYFAELDQWRDDYLELPGDDDDRQQPQS